ncbi:zinc finger protein 92 homolog [Mixophyes fleayi]|uniref:zinc finger protein 92 homolog n=1 Tax=Mixophyes fleayi TaxID=3061075 RepID=UPI003F4DED43
MVATSHMAGKTHIDFDDVAVYFSKKEWGCLLDEEKLVYKHVMMENYLMLISLGFSNITPNLISKIQRGEEPPVSDDQQTERQDKSTRKNMPDSCLNILVPGQHTRKYVTILPKGSHEDQKEAETPSLSMCSMSNGGPPAVSTSEGLSKAAQEDKRLFSCPECGKCFSRPSALAVHERMHTGEKPYVCLQCGKGFSSNSNLATHQRKHTGDMPHKCSECQKMFANRSHLVAHSRIHTSHTFA